MAIMPDNEYKTDMTIKTAMTKSLTFASYIAKTTGKHVTSKMSNGVKETVLICNSRRVVLKEKNDKPISLRCGNLILARA